LQHDDLLAKDGIFGEGDGAGAEGRTQCAQHHLEEFNEHFGAKSGTRGSPEKFR
jgi:hypothetical protein